MNLKEKIALNGLKRRLDRGAISLADAKAEYKKITGQDSDENDEPLFVENPEIQNENSENLESDEKKTADAYSGYSPPAVVTEPVTDPQTEEPLSEEMKAELRKHVRNTVSTIIERVKAQKEASPKRVDTQRAKKAEDPK